MKKSIVVLLHVLYWIPKIIGVIVILSVYSRVANLHLGNGDYPFFVQTASVFNGIICFYLFYLYLFPNFLAKKRFKLFVIYGLTSCAILSLSTLVVFNLIFNNISDKQQHTQFFINVIYSIPSAILASGLMGCLFKAFITWYTDIRVKEQLERKNLQSELALLKAQINPHFLFNTINNIDILIEKDAKAASEYLKQLSDIIRFMLYETSAERIPLSKELEYIEKYIRLQKIRTANEKFVNLNITGDTNNLTIAPAVFIPFIENAFKHSTNKKIENAISIDIEINQNNITFTCKNVFDNSNTFKQEGSGLGIDLIKQRLGLLYNDKHELSVNVVDNWYEVKLKIVIV